MIRARTILAGGALVLAAGAAATAALVGLQPAPPAAAPAAPAAATAEVTRGTLLDTRTLSGTLGYGDVVSLRPGLASGSGMVTWIAPAGATVARGEPLYAMDGQPVVLLYGETPLHRTLRFEGDDFAEPVWVELEAARADSAAARLAAQLEQERAADAEARIADAEARLADSRLERPVTPQFLHLSGAVAAAEARLARLRQLVDRSISSLAELAGAELDLANARANVENAVTALRGQLAAARLDLADARLGAAEARQRLRTTDDTLAALESRAGDDRDIRQLQENLRALGFAGPAAEAVAAWQRAAGLPATGLVGPGQAVIAPAAIRITEHLAGIGETLSDSGSERSAVLSFTDTAKLVTVELDVADQALAGVGNAVIVTLPDGDEIEGTIAEVGAVVVEGQTEVEIAIADQQALGALDAAAVEVEFVSEARENALSVPVAALLALPSGGFAVELVEDRGSRIVPVETGMFAGGRVEIEGDDVAEGARVGVPG